MNTLSIRNVGPIKNADLEINKVNIFIGPQSSGKSTIAKLISFCFWLEKSVVLNHGKEHVDDKFLYKELHQYHDMASYFHNDTHIEYHSDLIDFSFRNINDFSINVKNIDEGKNGKIAYIPSERNLVSIPNISTLDMSYNYIRSFIFDWLLVHNKYSKTTSFSILDLGINYYFDENKGDTLLFSDNKEIPLSEASSGLQALVPLMVYANYTSKWIYENEIDVSFDKYESLQKLLLKLIIDESKENTPYSDEDIAKAIKSDSIKRSLHQIATSSSYNLLGGTIAGFMERVAKPHFTKLVIEEPELSIFPKTQYELLKYIFGLLDFERGDSIVLTTHSPYVMTSINNFIQAASSIEDGADNNTVWGITGGVSLNYNDVNAWAIENGTIKKINDDEFKMISAEAIDSASDTISNDFDKLLNYATKQI